MTLPPRSEVQVAELTSCQQVEHLEVHGTYLIIISAITYHPIITILGHLKGL